MAGAPGRRRRAPLTSPPAAPAAPVSRGPGAAQAHVRAACAALQRRAALAALGPPRALPDTPIFVNCGDAPYSRTLALVAPSYISLCTRRSCYLCRRTVMCSVMLILFISYLSSVLCRLCVVYSLLFDSKDLLRYKVSCNFFLQFLPSIKFHSRYD